MDVVGAVFTAYGVPDLSFAATGWPRKKRDRRAAFKMVIHNQGGGSAGGVLGDDPASGRVQPVMDIARRSGIDTAGSGSYGIYDAHAVRVVVHVHADTPFVQIKRPELPGRCYCHQKVRTP